MKLSKDYSGYGNFGWQIYLISIILLVGVGFAEIMMTIESKDVSI